jgi:hypothetical protein
MPKSNLSASSLFWSSLCLIPDEPILTVFEEIAVWSMLKRLGCLRGAIFIPCFGVASVAIVVKAHNKSFYLMLSHYAKPKRKFRPTTFVVGAVFR